MSVTSRWRSGLCKEGTLAPSHLRSVSQTLVEENEISIEHVLLKEEREQKGNVPCDPW